MKLEPGDGPRSPQLELGDVLEALARRKTRLVLGLVLGLAAAYGVHRAIPPRYTAEATLLIESKQAPQAFVRTPVTDSMRDRIQTLKHRLTSDEMMSWLLGEVDAERLAPGASAEGRTDAIRKNLDLEIVNAASRDAAVLALSFEATDPDLATEVVGALTRRLVEERARERTAQTAATLESLDREVERMRDDLAAEAERVELAAQGRSDGRASGFDAATLEERRERRKSELAALQRLREEIAEAEAHYTPRHPKRLQLRAEFDALRGRLSAPVAFVGASLDGDDREDLSLLRDYRSKLESYEDLLGKQVEASMAYDLERSRGGGEIGVLRAARRPRRPSWPDPVLVAAAGAGSGLLLASVLVLWPTLRRPAFGSVDRLVQISGLPVVAATPRLRARRAWRRNRLGVDPRIVVASDPASVAAEQYRSFLPYLRESVGTPVVLVTSADRGEGKSLSAANFAASAALDAQRRVLLIDADLRRPSAHRLFHARRSPGLSDVIHGGDRSIESCAVATRVANLFLLASGSPVANPLQMLTRDAFLELIAQARRDFDAVFVDTPPLLPVVDTRIVERVASTILFVVRADATPRQSVLRSLKEIRGPVGVVFTGVSAYSYRRYYGTEPDARAYENSEGSRA
jgi:tyrosine-protein kinase Etk/Wzc